MCYPSKPELILRLDQDSQCLDHAHREENMEKEWRGIAALDFDAGIQSQRRGRHRNIGEDLVDPDTYPKASFLFNQQ